MWQCCRTAYETVAVAFSTFEVQRNVHIVHWKLELILWLMRLAIMVYFLYTTLRPVRRARSRSRFPTLSR